MKYFLSIILLVSISSCSSKNDYSFFLYPSGKGLTSLGKIDPDMEYLKETCKGSSRTFKILVEPKQKQILKTYYLKRYNLELIELVYFKGAMDKYELSFNQSGCIDSQLAIDFKFFDKHKTVNNVIENMRRSIKDLKFTSYSDGIQSSILNALTYLSKNIKRKCKTQNNFVAYKKRTLCTFNVDELHYQFIWGITSEKEVINLTSSYSAF